MLILGIPYSQTWSQGGVQPWGVFVMVCCLLSLWINCLVVLTRAFPCFPVCIALLQSHIDVRLSCVSLFYKLVATHSLLRLFFLWSLNECMEAEFHGNRRMRTAATIVSAVVFSCLIHQNAFWDPNTRPSIFCSRLLHSWHPLCCCVLRL